MPRLSLAALDRVPESARPAIDPRELSVGIVHLGIGAFHRAHQAAYTEAAIASSGDVRWGICGVSQRSPTVVEQLRPQDGLYTLLERSSQGDRAKVLGPVRDLLFAGAQGDAVLDRLAAPTTHVVTLTVTEKGYRHDPSSGRLIRSDSATLADVSGRLPVTVVGQLVRAMQRRMLDGTGGLSVVCCDNLPSNGRMLRGLVDDFCSLLPSAEGGPLQSWIKQHVRFPSTMVDRIVPATTDDDRGEVRDRLGVEDHGVVVAEPFSQWVVEDAFAGPRPAWERAGATFTGDVAPYEAMKLRLLNGSHSAMAYLGALAGYEFVADVMNDDAFAVYVEELMTQDVLPTLAVPAGFAIDGYVSDLLGRFRNAALRHRTAQIAMDGSQKLPQRLLGTILDRLQAGEAAPHATLAVAAWIRYVTAGRDDSGRQLQVDDPLADRFREIGTEAAGPAEVITRMLAVSEVFGTQLPQVDAFRSLLADLLSELSRHGAHTVIRAMSAGTFT